MDLNSIKPKNLKISDKYSANLYKYLKKNPNARIYMSKRCLIKDIPIEYGEGSLNTYNTFVGQIYDDFLSGNKLMEILQKNTNNHWAFMLSQLDLEDITEQFFCDYKSIGRCLWDKNHHRSMRYDDNRFTYINEDSRICNWCGQSHTKRIETETSVKEYEIWE